MVKRYPGRWQKHGLPAGAAVLSVLALVAVAHARLQADVTGEIADIAVEHTEPLEVMLAMSTRDGGGLLDIDHTGQETIYVSLPGDWELLEVRRTDLGAVSGEPPMLSFVRWTIPPGAGARFRLPRAPNGVLLHHSSPALLQVTATLVDLETERTERDVRLVKDKAIRLW